MPSWSKIQKVSIIHSEPITQTQTLEQQAKHCQLIAVTLKAACFQTKAPRLPAEMKLKKRKIKKLNFQLICFRRGRLVAAARNIKVGLKQQPLLIFRDGGAKWLVSKWSRGELLAMDGVEENHVMAGSAESVQQPCCNFAKFLFWTPPCCLAASFSVTWRSCPLVLTPTLCHCLKSLLQSLVVYFDHWSVQILHIIRVQWRICTVLWSSCRWRSLLFQHFTVVMSEPWQ